MQQIKTHIKVVIIDSAVLALVTGATVFFLMTVGF